MPTSVRLDPKTESMLRRIARRTGRSKSQVIREAILRLTEQTSEPPPGRSLYDRIQDLVGVSVGGPPDLASRSEEYLRLIFAGRRNQK
ncbi:MAG: ribbon-helix-helix protein, CopG family [bacterium]